MIVIDWNGKEITVANLEKAIKHAAAFQGYSHTHATPQQQATDLERKQYWIDMHKKLLQLQSKLTGKK